MARIEKGEFTIESSFDNPNDIRVNQRVDIRIPHKLANRSPLVFRVDLLANPPFADESRPIHHEVLVQGGQVRLLTAHELGYVETYRWYPDEIRHYQYIDASLFVLNQHKQDPDRYQIYTTTTGFACASLPTNINVGENRHCRAYKPYEGWDDWFDEVKDEGDMRIFAVRCSKGSNRIAIPKDLRPFVAKLTSKETIFAEKDLAFAVDFETYPF